MAIPEDYTQEVNLTIYDKNQEALSESEMNSLRIENNAKVVVTAKLWKIRTGVKIAAGYVGTPAGGYQVGSVKTGAGYDQRCRKYRGSGEFV